MDIKVPVDRVGFDRAIAGVHVQVGVAGHVYFDAKRAVISPAKAEAAANAGADLNLIATLVRSNGEVPVHRIAAVDDVKFDLLGVAGGYANRAVVRIHMDASPAAHSVRLSPFFSARRTYGERAGKNG